MTLWHNRHLLFGYLIQNKIWYQYIEPLHNAKPTVLCRSITLLFLFHTHHSWKGRARHCWGVPLNLDKFCYIKTWGVSASRDSLIPQFKVFKIYTKQTTSRAQNLNIYSASSYLLLCLSRQFIWFLVRGITKKKSNELGNLSCSALEANTEIYHSCSQCLPKCSQSMLNIML